MNIIQAVCRAWTYYRDDLFGYAGSRPAPPTYNPNAQQRVARFLRVTPRAGAAMYPVKLELEQQGKVLLVTGPGFYDLGRDETVRILPVTFSEAFSPSPTLYLGSIIQAPTPIMTPPPPLAGFPVVSQFDGIDMSGFVSGDFFLESVADLATAQLLAGVPPVPSSPWVAAYGAHIDLPDDNDPNAWPSPWAVPDYAATGLPNDALHLGGFFLGCGASVVRYTLLNADGTILSGAPVTLQKFFLGPFSKAWEAGGTLTFDPLANAQVEETINLDVPTWLVLWNSAAHDSNRVTIMVSRQPE